MKPMTLAASIVVLLSACGQQPGSTNSAIASLAPSVSCGTAGSDQLRVLVASDRNSAQVLGGRLPTTFRSLSCKKWSYPNIPGPEFTCESKKVTNGRLVSYFDASFFRTASGDGYNVGLSEMREELGKAYGKTLATLKCQKH